MDPKYKIKIIIISFTYECNYLFADNNNESSANIDFNIEYITDFKLYKDKLKEIGFENLVKISTFNEFYAKYSSPSDRDNKIHPIISIYSIMNKKMIMKYIESRFNIKINTTHINNYKLILDCNIELGIIYDLQNKNPFVKCDICNGLDGKIISNLNFEEYNNYIYIISLLKNKVYTTIKSNIQKYNCFARKEEFKFSRIKKTDIIKTIEDCKNYLFNKDKLLLSNIISVKKLTQCVVNANTSLYNIAYTMKNYKNCLSILSDDNYVKTYLKSVIKSHKKDRIKNIGCDNCVLILDLENEVCYIIFY